MYPSTFYRVTAKALILDGSGKILVVKENEDFWSLPGGGMEHGEAAPACLERELQEELGIESARIGRIAYSTSVYLDRTDTWMLWVVYHAAIDTADFKLGDGVTDARYIDIEELADSTDLLERLVVETTRAIKITKD